MKWYFLLAWVLGLSTAHAEDISWQKIDDVSAINFSVAIEGNSTSGSFPQFTTDIIFDPVALDKSHIEVIIDLSHIEAVYNDVAENLKKKPWFDVVEFPKAYFAGKTFIHLEGQKYKVIGALTLRDITRTETLFFTLVEFDEAHAVITGTMKINRLDYGVGQGAWRDISSVASEISLDIGIRAERK